MACSFGRRRRLGAICGTAIALAAVLCGSRSSGADPAPSSHDVAKARQQVRERAADVGRISAALAQADGLLDTLSGDAELAVERFDGARVRVDQARQAYAAAAQRASQADQRLAETRRELAVFAVKVYRTDNTFPSEAAVLGGEGGPQGFLERAVIMQVLMHRQAGYVEQERAVETVAGLFERQAHQALTAQQDAMRSADAARDAASAAVDRQRAAVSQTRQRKQYLLAQLGKARAYAVGVQQARAAAVARQRAGTQIGTMSGRAAARSLARGSGLGSAAAVAALKWLGTPYSWGGGNASGPTLGIAQGAHTVGFDCSGLVTYAWAHAGVNLVHYATTQYNSGPHPSRDQLRPGDLVFFAHDPSNPSTIHHVGIYIGHGQMVEAPFTGAHVRISPAFRPDYAGATRPSG